MRAEEAVAQLRESICAPARLEGPTPASALSALHPLACSSTGLARRRIRTALASLRASLQAREQWDMRPETRDALLHVLRDTDTQRKLLTTARTTLQKCLEMATTQDPFATPCASAAARIIAAAKRAGAVTHEEPQPPGKGPLVSVCGSTFMADFQVHALSGAADVKFRNIDASGVQVPGDRNVDEDFARLVAAADFAQLEKAFCALVELEALDTALGDGVPLRKGIAAFENDLLAMQSAEIGAGCAPAMRVMRGHGLIRRCAHGLRIAYAKDRTVLLSAEDAPEPRRLVLGSSSPVAVPGSALPMTPPRFEFAVPASAAAAAHYVLVLDQPLAVTLKVALELERIATPLAKLKRPVANMGPAPPQRVKRMREEDPFTAPFPSPPPKPSTQGNALQAAVNVTRMLPGHVDSFPSIQMLLAPKAFAAENVTARDSAVAEAAAPGSAGGTTPAAHDSDAGMAAHFEGRTEVGVDSTNVAKLTSLAKTSPDGRVLSRELNEYVCCVGLPGDEHITLSHNVSNLVAGVTITRVPVTEPSDVLVVFSILRQQLAFNELFVSCFGAPGGITAESTALVDELVEVVLCDAPEFMHFSIFDARVDGVVGLAISVGKDGTFAAKISGLDGRPHGCGDKKATEILMQTRSVPRTIQAITKIGAEGGSGMYA